jgi:hypothetical protein
MPVYPGAHKSPLHSLTRSLFPFNEPQTASIHLNGVISPFWGLSRR